MAKTKKSDFSGFEKNQHIKKALRYFAKDKNKQVIDLTQDEKDECIKDYLEALEFALENSNRQGKRDAYKKLTSLGYEIEKKTIFEQIEVTDYIIKNKS